MFLRQAIILATLSAGLFSASNASAEGNVLLPSDSSDKGPNMGLIAVEPAPPLPEAPKPVEVKTPEPEKPTPTPTPQAAVPAYAPPAYAAPTPYSQPIPQQPPSGPIYTINVALAKASWTPADIDVISTQLGLAKNTVAAHCRMGINGMLSSDIGTSQVDSNGSTNVTVQYQGAANNAMLSVYAACDSAPQMPAYNFVQRAGNMFIVSLSSAFCQPKVPVTGNMRQIAVTHVANTSDACAFMP